MASMVPEQPNQQVVQLPNTQPIELKNSQPVKDPEVPQETKSSAHPVEDNGDSRAEEDDDPRNPLMEFDWEEFDTRYRQAMLEANDKEQALREDFARLVQYFGVWVSAASHYDNDRSVKRIKTRRLYVQHDEETLEQKRQHYTQVVEAFKNALALLGNS